jgi:hypothetical protein
MEWRIKLEAKTGWGEVTEVEIATLSRRAMSATDEDIGLSLAESKAILASLQQAMVTAQIDEYVTCARVCRSCLKFLPIRDHRTRKLQTLFGTVVVSAPRIQVCDCVNHLDLHDVRMSSLADLLPDRCTPELRRLQAELGARLSYREAGKVLSALLPCPRPNHSSIRNRLARVAQDIDDRDQMTVSDTQIGSNADAAAANSLPVTVILDGAHIRAIPTTQSRLVDITVGKVLDSEGNSRRFGFALRGGPAPHSSLRAVLVAQGWQPGSAVTVISDGEPALRNLVKSATGEPVTHILDWWHLSIRVQHIEQTINGMRVLDEPAHPTISHASFEAGRIRHLLWNGYAEEALDSLHIVQNWARRIFDFAGAAHEARAKKLWAHCADLKTYVGNSEAAIIDYSRRYYSKLPVASSVAEGCVDEIANSRMGKKQRMRWSPRGAHRVVTVRAAMLDNRLHRQITPQRKAA